ncbi:hypothetical protein GCM10022222_78840 [Amycolatopsis ultiminotia]|uniref:Uncharacterized protein n=1 Tax=Amycolatopsis ultiminotia TaxID=543629 RepID=A0ABP6YF53_9PSEU
MYLGAAVHPVFVPAAGGDPHAAVCAGDPGAVPGVHGEDSAADVEQLVVVVPVPGDDVTGRVLMAGLRHSTTVYRKSEDPARGIVEG